MKINIQKYIGLVVSFLVLACSEETVNPNNYVPVWVDSAELDFTVQGEEGNFVYTVSPGTGQEFWGVTDLVYHVAFKSNDAAASDISKIEFYAFLEEKNGDGYNFLGGQEGKLLTTIENPTDVFEVTFTKDDMFDIFKSDFTGSRSDILTGDLFEIRWVITGKDGMTVDTRNGCYDAGCSFGFLAKEKVVDTWEGEFDYKWIEVGGDTKTYSWAGLDVGSTGKVAFSKSENYPGSYDIDDLSMGAAYGSPAAGYVTYDNTTNTLTVTDPGSYANAWELVSQTDEVLTIKWTYYYSQWYDENGTVEISRADGLSWPAGLTVVNN